MIFMYCPKCGNELDLFADKCLKCGKSFKGLSLAERQKLEDRPRPKRHSTRQGTGRVEYNNGYATREGMSITGGRLKKGSFKKRPNNEGIGFHFSCYGLGQGPR